ncbi:MAG TPA: hypothetical protein VGV35_16670 [Bryobacteraceae bacterium]|nr:hypothetical protein [Bryobacteraceae bacterium]
MRLILTAAATVLPILLSTACAPPPPVPTDAQDTCPLPPPTFAGWFQSGAVSLNGVVNPADSLVTLNPDCDFYAWSEQMFMWLTSPAPPTYGGGAHIFDSPAFFDVSPPDGTGKRTFLAHTAGLIRVFPIRSAQRGPQDLQVVADRSGRLLEFKPVDPNLKAMVRDPSGKPVEIAHARLENGRTILLDQEGKVIAAQHVATVVPSAEPRSSNGLVQKFVIDKISIFIDPSLAVIDVEQGQADAGVLEAQAAANGSLVYYATMVNDVYAYFLTGVKDGAIVTTTPNQFPTTLADLNNTIAFATAHGKGPTPFPDPHAMAIEVKSSWVLAAGLPNLSSYITMTATIPTYNTANPNLWTPTGQQTVQLALVGIHVVGSTLGHPEMVWATFEHVGNTPNATYSYTSTGGPKTVNQNTSGTWVFSASGSAGPFNVAHMTFTGPPNNQIQSTGGFTISPSDTLRSDPWGIDGGNAFSNTEVISMNSHVRGMMAAGDIRGNYVMSGATWTPFGSPPIGPTPGVGTNRLANTTMETYQQSVSNCFTCHQNGLNPNGLSHIYGGLQPLF